MSTNPTGTQTSPAVDEAREVLRCYDDENEYTPGRGDIADALRSLLEALPAERETVGDAGIDQIIGFMATDKSNDWTAEIATLKNVERQLAAARAGLASIDKTLADLGGEDQAVRYAKLGRFIAISLGSNEEWDNDSLTEDANLLWHRLGGVHTLGDQDDEALKYWRTLAPQFGISHDGPEADDDETCREEGCENNLDDGEGYDGYCGEHADQHDAAGKWDGE